MPTVSSTTCGPLHQPGSMGEPTRPCEISTWPSSAPRGPDQHTFCARPSDCSTRRCRRRLIGSRELRRVVVAARSRTSRARRAVQGPPRQPAVRSRCGDHRRGLRPRRRKAHIAVSPQRPPRSPRTSQRPSYCYPIAHLRGWRFLNENSRNQGRSGEMTAAR